MSLVKFTYQHVVEDAATLTVVVQTYPWRRRISDVRRASAGNTCMLGSRAQTVPPCVFGVALIVASLSDSVY